MCQHILPSEAEWMDHTVLIHYSSVHGCLGCFHLSATVNDAAVDLGAQLSARVSFPDQSRWGKLCLI